MLETCIVVQLQWYVPSKDQAKSKYILLLDSNLLELRNVHIWILFLFGDSYLWVQNVHIVVMDKKKLEVMS